MTSELKYGIKDQGSEGLLHRIIGFSLKGGPQHKKTLPLRCHHVAAVQLSWGAIGSTALGRLQNLVTMLRAPVIVRSMSVSTPSSKKESSAQSELTPVAVRHNLGP